MTDFLFAMPSFVAGIARVLDLGSTFTAYNDSPTTEVADARALKADWRATANDLNAAMKSADENTPAEPQQLALTLGR